MWWFPAMLFPQVSKMPAGAANISAKVIKPMICIAGGRTRFPITSGFLVTRTMRRLSGGASAPLITAEKKHPDRIETRIIERAA